eukprot:92919-Ditylum_brightwellii.AAC.1
MGSVISPPHATGGTGTSAPAHNPPPLHSGGGLIGGIGMPPALDPNAYPKWMQRGILAGLSAHLIPLNFRAGSLGTYACAKSFEHTEAGV